MIRRRHVSDTVCDQYYRVQPNKTSSRKDFTHLLMCTWLECAYDRNNQRQISPFEQVLRKHSEYSASWKTNKYCKWLLTSCTLYSTLFTTLCLEKNIPLSFLL